MNSIGAGERTSRIELTWHHLSKFSMMSGVIQLFSFLLAAALIAVKQILEADSIDGLWDLALHLGLTRGWWIFAGLIALSLIATMLAALSWRFTMFALSADGIHVKSGVLVKKHTHVRWDRIQNVNMTQSVIARIFKQGTLIVESAGGAAEKLRLGLLSLPQCTALRRTILDLSAASRSGAVIDVPDWQSGVTPDESSMTPDPDEQLLYSLGTKRLIGASLVSGSMVGGLLSLGGGIALAVGTSAGAASLPLFFVVAGSIWSAIKKLEKSWGTRVYVAPHGLRIRSGLVTTYAQTLPSGRIHAVEISQPLLWRPWQWWRIRVVIAAADLSDAAETSQRDSVVIPAGHRAEVEHVIGVLFPDLGVADSRRLIHESCEGEGDSATFVAAPRESRWLDPVGWRHNALALTRTVAVLRWAGFWRRSVRIVGHEHVQSLRLSQGPLQRRFKLASLTLCLAGTAFPTEQRNMDVAVLWQLAADERELGKNRRKAAECDWVMPTRENVHEERYDAQ